jgi:TPR repeat protein
MTSCGRCYHDGLGVERDHARAVSLFREAAAKGDAPAMGNLGLSYSFGQGIPRDEALAVSWWENAAALGEANAQYHLGVAIMYGTHGTQKNTARGLELLNASATQGHTEPVAEAQFAADMCKIEGSNVMPVDIQGDKELVRASAAQGHPEAVKTVKKIELLELLESGLSSGLPDRDQFKKEISRAVLGADTYPLLAVGTLLVHGGGGFQNNEWVGKKCLRLAAAQAPGGESTSAQEQRHHAKNAAKLLHDLNTCASCDAPGAVKLCACCRKTRYCGSSCQRSHWRAHKATCRPCQCHLCRRDPSPAGDEESGGGCSSASAA